MFGKSNLPTLHEISPEVAQIAAKIAEVQQRRREIRRELNALAVELKGTLPPSLPPADDALANVLGKELGHLARTRPAPADVKLAERWAVFNDRQREDAALARAEDLLHGEHARARAVASIKLCRQLLPEYDRRASAVAEAAQTLHAALEEIRELSNSVQVQGGSAASLDVLPALVVDRASESCALLMRQTAERAPVIHRPRAA